ncbi:MAG: ATP-binding protein [Moraxellaceae bacterium]|nr:MAG: ATP-binding protein [Moraxellaceae bacterium]
MKQIFGSYIEPDSGEHLKISFYPDALPLQQRWRNNGLSADFLAGYISSFFPGEDPIASGRQNEIKDAVSFIANELLENAMKYCVENANTTVSIEMFLEADVISLYTTNSINTSDVEPFQQHIKRLLTEDPGDLYMEQLETNAESDGDSGMGYLTMLNDYGTAIAWRFGESTDNSVVTTMVRLNV